MKKLTSLSSLLIAEPMPTHVAPEAMAIGTVTEVRPDEQISGVEQPASRNVFEIL